MITLMKSFMAKNEEMPRKWYLIDANGKVLGRLATAVADILRGKRKPTFTPHVDCGDFVVIINAEKIRVTGKKNVQMEYLSFSGYPGGQRVRPYERVLAEHPERIIQHAVRGMVPTNPLGRAILTKLKVYKGAEHPHKAQNPEKLEV